MINVIDLDTANWKEIHFGSGSIFLTRYFAVLLPDFMEVLQEFFLESIRDLFIMTLMIANVAKISDYKIRIETSFFE